MARRRARRPRGARVPAAVPHGYWNTSTFVAGLRADVIVAPLVLAGAINASSSRAYVELFLAPCLRPGNTVVIDNHKVKGVRKAIEAVGARMLFLPPYSLDLNPIEQLFAKLKALRRTAARRTAARRTVDGLWSAIGTAPTAFSPDECRNYAANCGYSYP